MSLVRTTPAGARTGRVAGGGERDAPRTKGANARAGTATGGLVVGRRRAAQVCAREATGQTHSTRRSRPPQACDMDPGPRRPGRPARLPEPLPGRLHTSHRRPAPGARGESRRGGPRRPLSALSDSCQPAGARAHSGRRLGPGPPPARTMARSPTPARHRPSADAAEASRAHSPGASARRSAGPRAADDAAGAPIH
uniref:putative uncharacterized protein MGC34800 n=1 Tax=Jaculus jaculus TaxID=51337 RepID=UPI001E1B5357|nr:putative uncharacterized protein MGC34800 [Jaculus jaculus]